MPPGTQPVRPLRISTDKTFDEAGEVVTHTETTTNSDGTVVIVDLLGS